MAQNQTRDELISSERMKRILGACKMVLECSRETIKILQDNSVCNIRSIERNSRSIKDPNPLMSALTNVNLKYPITYIRALIPKEFDDQDETLSTIEDSRRKGRYLCKFQAIPNWIKFGPVPKDDVKNSIDSLLKPNLSKLNSINSIDLEST